MRIERVVVDASPLIVLFKSGLADLLPGLFTEIVVPASVRREVMINGRDDAAINGLANASWVTHVEDPIVSSVIAAWDLGAGESSVLAFAATQPAARAVLDDRAARNCAKALQIRTLGTLGVVVLAKRRGMIPSVRTALAKISGAGCWLSAELIQMAVTEAGEA